MAPTAEWLNQSERSPADRPERSALTSGDGSPYGLAVLRDEIDTLRAAQVGTRNHQLNRSSLLGVALGIGLDEPESRQTIGSAFAAGLQKLRVAAHRLRGLS